MANKISKKINKYYSYKQVKKKTDFDMIWYAFR